MTLLLLWMIQTNVHSTPVDSLACRSCFVTTVCSTDFRHMAIEDNDTLMNVDFPLEPSVHKEEVPAWGNSWRRVEEK